MMQDRLVEQMLAMAATMKQHTLQTSRVVQDDIEVFVLHSFHS
jgi:hypothetical protein